MEKNEKCLISMQTFQAEKKDALLYIHLHQRLYVQQWRNVSELLYTYIDFFFTYWCWW
jgi:hypothetical protein